MLNSLNDSVFQNLRTLAAIPAARLLARIVQPGGLVLAAASLSACQAPAPPRPALPPPTISASDPDPATAPAAPRPSDAWRDLEHLLDASGHPQGQPSQPVSVKPAGPLAFHTLVLQTFPGDSGDGARRWHAQLTRVIPPLADRTAVHVDDKGSLVVFGQYEGWDDPQAAADMRTLQNLRVNDKRIFGAIMRTDVRPRRPDSALHPHELTALRRRHPNVRTIYTLEIEVWGSFESGSMTPAARRQLAEQRVASLRAEGVPAFFHHDPVNDLSTVTVGAFDEKAIDPSSGLVSLDVQEWQTRFPNRLVNGADLRLPVQGQPELGAVTQRSRLVLVPNE